MTLVIDCRMFRASGVGVYLRCCLSVLLRAETGAAADRFLLLGNEEDLGAFAGGHENVEILPCQVKPFSLAELAAFPYPILAIINRADCFYSPYFNIPGGITVPIFTTIHDIIFPDMRELTSPWGLKARMWFYRRAAKKSAGIFTVSEFSKSRIAHFLGEKTPITVTYTGIQPHFLDESPPAPAEKLPPPAENSPATAGKLPPVAENSPTAVIGTEAGQGTFILFVGNIKKHKGLSVLLEAFFQAKKLGFPHSLVILGEKSAFRTKDTETLALVKNAPEGDVAFTGFVRDDELTTLYHKAVFLVQPSLYEGFGLPPLEALVCGTPVLLSDIPVFREIYGDFPVTFFEAGNAAALKEALLEHREAKRVHLGGDLKNRYTFENTVRLIQRTLDDSLSPPSPALR